MKLQLIVRTLVHSYGPTVLKRCLWNTEFANGRWDCLEATLGDCVYHYIEKYVRGGSILDLGCGSGSTGNEIDVKAYTHYTGVDISDVAIGKAREQSWKNNRLEKNCYSQGEIFTYVPSQLYDVILFRDSIYYVGERKIVKMLNRYSRYLTNNGVFIVRMWNGVERFRLFVEAIESNFFTLEKYVSRHPDAVVIVFRKV